MLGFFGAGNMATAILRGVLSSGLLSPDELAIYDIDNAKTAALSQETGVAALGTPKALIDACDTLLLAVKPQVLPLILNENADLLAQKHPLLISIAAGKTLAFYAEHLSASARVVRVMPNINATVGAAVSAFCGNAQVTADDLAFTQKLCESFGTALSLPEAQFPIFGVLGGCAPTFVFLMIDAMAAAGVKNGLPKQTALAISAQTVLGSAKLLLESDKHPRALIDAVCSPGGTTIEGVLSLQKDGFEAAMHAAIQAALEKDKRL